MALQRYRSYLYTMKAQDKLQEAGGKFKKGVKFIDVCYPLSTKQCIQLEDEVFIKSQWPNLLWVRAFAPIGVAMDCVIYDSNMDKWATFEALPKKEAKPLIYVNPLQIKKGDVVVCNDGRKGRITTVSYTHLRAHETVLDLVCRLLLEKKKEYNVTHTQKMYIEILS